MSNAGAIHHLVGPRGRSIRSIATLAILGGLLAHPLAGCGSSKDDKSSPKASGKPVADKVEGSSATTPSITEVEAAPPPVALPVPDLREPQVVEQVLAVVADWASAQTAGDFDRYLSLYDDKSFRGIRRTANGTEKSFDFAGWRDDRQPMVGKKPLVIADFAQVMTWHATGGSRPQALEPGFAEARFTQRFKLGKYADHGPKILRFRWHGNNAGWKIVYEDMLSSEKGLGSDSETPEVARLDLTGLAAPLEGKTRFIESTEAEDSYEEAAPTILLTFKGAKGKERTLNLSTDTAGCGVEEKPGAHALVVACFWAGAGASYELDRKGDVLVATRILEDEELAEDLRYPYAEIALPKGAEISFGEEHVSAN